MDRQEAIKVVKDNWPESRHQLSEDLQTLIPEFQESDNEKIRKFINHELACLRATDEKGSDRYEELTNAIAWLEKQGELERSDCSYFDKGCKAGISDRQLSDEEMKELLRTEYEKGRYDATTETKWKPTEEQMHVLYNSVLCCLDVEDIPILDTLYQDLKKLQEE
jgi:hypothetical protein